MPPFENPKATGERFEASILACLIHSGYAVSMPFGNNQRYDMMVDDGKQLLRAQCKTGRYENGSVCFPTAGRNGFTGERRNYRGQADIFLVYCPTLGKVYQVPADETTSNLATLRVEPPQNLTNTIKWAKAASFLVLFPERLQEPPYLFDRSTAPRSPLSEFHAERVQAWISPRLEQLGKVQRSRTLQRLAVGDTR